MRQVQVGGLEEVCIDGACEDGDGLEPAKDEAIDAGDCWRGGSG